VILNGATRSTAVSVAVAIATTATATVATVATTRKPERMKSTFPTDGT
jgi:chloramphenicol 3-O-phosphotransferase